MDGINYTHLDLEQKGETLEGALEQARPKDGITPARSELEALIENSRDLIFRVDRNLRHLYVNKAVLETTGLSREQYVGKTNGELGMPEDLCDLWDRVFLQAFESGDPRETEFTYTGAQGPRYYQLRIVPERAPDGGVNTVVGIARDITDEKKMEEQLRQTEGALKRHQEEIETLIEERTRDLNCLYKLSNVVQQFDSSLQEILARVPDLLVSSSSYPEVACARVVLGDQAFGTDNFQETPWGLSVPVMAEGGKVGAIEVGYLEKRPECDEGPFLTGERTLINNVAHRLGKLMERNQARERLELQWKQFAALFDNFVDSLNVVDPQTHEVLLVNESLKRAIGKDPVGGICYKELQGLDAPCDFCTNDIILRERKPYTWEYHNPMTGRSYLMTDQIIKWPDGRDVKFEVAVDITERKRTENALRESGRRLRQISRKLAGAQETERKYLAKELHDSIGGKLSGIKYGVEKLLKEMGDNQSSEGLSLQDVLSMIKETIEDSRRLSARLRPPELDDLGLLRTVRSTCRRFGKLYARIRVETDFKTEEEEIPESLKIVIYRVLEEALTNVAKHGNAQVVRISLGKKENGSELIIQDDGDGFCPEDFDDDGADGMSRQGLSNMRERTELAGGIFRIESEKGRGTTIRAFWPRLSMGNGLQKYFST